MNDVAATSVALRPDGAEVLRLQTVDGAPIRGHALLIGAPLAGLRGVPECLAAMRGWLESRGFLASRPATGSEASSIEEQMEALLDDVEPGDWVLVYYAGHGMQVLPGADEQFQPLAVLMPIDAFESEVVIPGDVWMGWMRALAKKAVPSQGEGPGVVLVLECCHAAALMERWPEAEARAAVVSRIREGLAARKVRDPSDPLPEVVRVLATGRDDRAAVGEMTLAMTRLLRQHLGEPWWALMDRLRVGWVKAQQHPGVAGPIDRIPLSVDRFERPAGIIPCGWHEGEWTVEHAGTAGWTSHRRLALTPSLHLPAQAWAELAADGSRLRVLDPRGGWSPSPDDFAWAWAAPHGRRAAVMVGGDDPRRRRNLAQRLEPLARMVYEDTPLGRATDAHGLVRFIANGNTVEIRDRWGDRVACTSHHDEDVWSAWLDRLLSLDDWLAVAEQGSPWPQDAIRLRWGTWRDGGEPSVWPLETPTITNTSPLWVEVEAEPWVRAHVSLFRIRVDRAVEWVSAHAPGGLSLAGHSVATVGTKDDPLRFELPRGSVVDDELRTEVLVALACDHPLPLSLLARGPVGAPSMRPSVAFRGERDRALRLAMLVRPYRIRANSTDLSDLARESAAAV